MPLDLLYSEREHQNNRTYSIVTTSTNDTIFSWSPPALSVDQLGTLAQLEAQIEELAGLPENWDGYGSLPLSALTRFHSLAWLRGLLLSAPPPEVTPNPNGTISFEWETSRGSAQLEIGQSKISFYIKPEIGQAIFIDEMAANYLILSINIGLLINASLFPLAHRTVSLTQVCSAGYVSFAY